MSSFLRTGTIYAFGHASVVFVLGVAAMARGERLPAPVDAAMGVVVGVTLVEHVVTGKPAHSTSRHDHPPTSYSTGVTLTVRMLHWIGTKTHTQRFASRDAFIDPAEFRVGAPACRPTEPTGVGRPHHGERMVLSREAPYTSISTAPLLPSPVESAT